MGLVVVVGVGLAGASLQLVAQTRHEHGWRYWLGAVLMLLSVVILASAPSACPLLDRAGIPGCM